MHTYQKYWKLTESHWTSAGHSCFGSESCDYNRVYSSKKRAIEAMKRKLRDWLEWEDDKKRVACMVLLETDEHVTAMSYDARLDSWRAIDIILEPTTIG